MDFTKIEADDLDVGPEDWALLLEEISTSFLDWDIWSTAFDIEIKRPLGGGGYTYETHRDLVR